MAKAKQPMGTELPASRRVAANLRFLRKARNLSQQQLAQISGLPKSTINHIESGASSPSIDSVEMLARALGIAIDELISAPSREFEIKTQSEMPVTKEVVGVAVIRRVLPDPFEGVDFYFGELSRAGTIAGAVQKRGGQKLIFCTEGSIQIQISGDLYEVSRGSACLFQGDVAHSIRNMGPKKASFFKVHFYRS